MDIDSILAPERTFTNVVATSKKRAIEEAANLIAHAEPGFDAAELYHLLIAREKLGPTAIGNGMAIPHCRVACTKTVGSLFHLSNGIDFGALDDLPVKIMFVLLVPESETEDHLHTLAMLARRFESEAYRDGLLAARSNDELFQQALIEPNEVVPKAAQ
tara:strand:- start:480 stop:956 length:477 start_codon:yes stop_codon:yes gene_type:complete